MGEPWVPPHELHSFEGYGAVESRRGSDGRTRAFCRQRREEGLGRSPGRRSRHPSRIAGRPGGDCDPGPVRALLRAAARLLLPQARQPRGGRGRRPADVPERVPRPEAWDRPGGRVRVALQDRRERLPHPATLFVPARPGRDTRRHPGAPGVRRRAAADGDRRADPAAEGARRDAGDAVQGDPPPRVAGPLVPRDRGRDGAHAAGRRDTHLPRAPVAGRGARAPGGADDAPRAAAERASTSPRLRAASRPCSPAVSPRRPWRQPRRP